MALRIRDVGFINTMANSAHEDRFSTLPNDVVLDILSRCCSYKTVVQCSTLSKRWHRFYTLLPSLHLSEKYLIQNMNKCKYSSESGQQQLLRFLTTLVLRHAATLESFSLEASDDVYWDHCLQQLILCKNNKQINNDDRGIILLRRLEFTSTKRSPTSKHSIVPPSLFSLTALESLYLSRFRIVELPQTFLGFRNLSNLELHSFDIVALAPVLEKLVRCCNSLRCLRITSLAHTSSSRNMNRPLSLLVSSPTLSVFEISCESGYDYLPTLHITMDTPNLVEMHQSSGLAVMRCHLFSRGQMQILREGLVTGKWSSSSSSSSSAGVLTYLEVHVKEMRRRCLRYYPVEFPRDLSGFSSLRVLKIYYPKASPLDFWHILVKLPHLLQFSLEDCIFKDSEPTKLDAAKVTNLTRFEAQITYFTQSAIETMLTLLLEKAPMLKNLQFFLRLSPLSYVQEKEATLSFLQDLLCKLDHGHSYLLRYQVTKVYSNKKAPHYWSIRKEIYVNISPISGISS